MSVKMQTRGGMSCAYSQREYRVMENAERRAVEYLRRLREPSSVLRAVDRLELIVGEYEDKERLPDGWE